MEIEDKVFISLFFRFLLKNKKLLIKNKSYKMKIKSYTILIKENAYVFKIIINTKLVNF